MHEITITLPEHTGGAADSARTLAVTVDTVTALDFLKGFLWRRFLEAPLPHPALVWNAALEDFRVLDSTPAVAQERLEREGYTLDVADICRITVSPRTSLPAWPRDVMPADDPLTGEPDSETEADDAT